MNGQHDFEVGQRVRHRARPEWGDGVIQAAEAVSADGGRAQRLTVTFTHYGRITLNTAHARLERLGVPATDSEQATTPNMNQSRRAQPQTEGGWLSRLESATGRGDGNGSLTALPDEATDPFRSLSARLKTTAKLWRFSTEPRSLMDWAVAQTGLEDPLSRYNRHELEQQFKVFDQARLGHLRELIQTARKSGDGDAQATVEALKADANTDVRAAVQRALRSL